MAEPDRAIRYCLRVDEHPVAMISRAVVQQCEDCGTDVWVDPAQELPAEHRVIGVKIMCSKCVLADPVLGPAMMGGIRDVFRDWVRTGTIRAIHVDDDDET